VAVAQSPAPSTSPSPAASPVPSLSPLAVSFRDSQTQGLLKAVLPDVRSVMPVTVYQLKNTGLGAGRDYLARAIPASIIRYLQFLPAKTLSSAELLAESKALIAGIRSEAGKKYADALALLDADLLTQSLDGEKKLVRQTNVDELARAWRKAQLLESSDLLQEKQRGFSFSDPESDLALSTISFTKAALVSPDEAYEMWKKTGAWFLLSGTIEERDEIITIRIVLFHTLLQKVVVDQTLNYSISSIQRAPDELGAVLAHGLLGYKPASLAVMARPDDAYIVIDPAPGMKRGNTWVMLTPGTYRVSTRAPGYKSDSIEIVLSEGMDAIVPVTLVKGDARRMKIETVPPGAYVFDGVNLLGVTPYDYTIPVSEKLLIIEQEGYRRQTVRVGPQSPERIMLVLFTELFDWDRELAVRRDKVYDSLGGFAVSLVLPIVFDGLFQIEQQAYAANLGASKTFLTEVQQRGLVYYYLRNMSFAINAVLFLDAVGNIVSYVEAAGKLDFTDASRSR